jgi:hypothetical protein
MARPRHVRSGLDRLSAGSGVSEKLLSRLSILGQSNDFVDQRRLSTTYR